MGGFVNVTDAGEIAFSEGKRVGDRRCKQAAGAQGFALRVFVSVRTLVFVFPVRTPHFSKILVLHVLL